MGSEMNEDYVREVMRENDHLKDRILELEAIVKVYQSREQRIENQRKLIYEAQNGIYQTLKYPPDIS